MVVNYPSSPTYFILLLITITRLISTVGNKTEHLHNNFNLSPDLISRHNLNDDPESLESASRDFGNLVHHLPRAVLRPRSHYDIASLVKASYEGPVPFTISVKGQGHSTRGQAMTRGGVVVDMRALREEISKNKNKKNIRVIRREEGYYGDVGGEALWADVLQEAAEIGVAPASWTDYLYLTVGGTLSNGGISGQSFKYGPQISIVNEMDVITGKGEVVTCSSHTNSELFHGVLGGLGQFGIITRARIALHPAPKMVKWEIQGLVEGLSYMPGFYYEKNVSYVEFLNRVRSGELKLQSEGLWDVPHPWLNLFIPKSQIMDFDLGVFKNIIFKRNITTGPVLIYPMDRSKWDNRMSASIPEEDIFYTVGFLHSSGFDNWKAFDAQNKEILKFCNDAGIKVKQYLPHYTTQEDWTKHFGPNKWRTFLERKLQFDPRMILSPGQRIFNND
ncbi:Cytokinin dehydrogenase [Stylosanthes scabra]|uniref:cytokinin dehydrogenase n=1 Tax=Stylosanthes scabra TaxID=79078 RepID=A0ABU6WM87_9FABA|nr:Cytokinin dehydrogenase [Stylosanthes scabra]